MLSRNISLSKQYDLIMVCYHEAGHAIYALLHSIKVEGIDIREDKINERIEGLTHYVCLHEDEFGSSPVVNKILTAEVGVKYAGLIAEKEHFKNISGSDKFPSFLKDGSSDDTISAAHLIRKYKLSQPGRKRYIFKKKLINSVSKDLQANWNAVTVLAHFLFSKKKINYPVLKYLLTHKTNNREFWKKKLRAVESIFDSNQEIDDKYLNWK